MFGKQPLIKVNGKSWSCSIDSILFRHGLIKQIRAYWPPTQSTTCLDAYNETTAPNFDKVITLCIFKTPKELLNAMQSLSILFRWIWTDDSFYGNDGIRLRERWWLYGELLYLFSIYCVVLVGSKKAKRYSAFEAWTRHIMLFLSASSSALSCHSGCSFQQDLQDNCGVDTGTIWNSCL